MVIGFTVNDNHLLELGRRFISFKFLLHIAYEAGRFGNVRNWKIL